MPSFSDFIPTYRRDAEQRHAAVAAIDVDGLGQWLAARARSGALPDITSLRLLIDHLDDQAAPPSIRRAALEFWRAYERWAAGSKRRPRDAA